MRIKKEIMPERLYDTLDGIERRFFRGELPVDKALACIVGLRERVKRGFDWTRRTSNHYISAMIKELNRTGDIVETIPNDDFFASEDREGDYVGIGYLIDRLEGSVRWTKDSGKAQYDYGDELAA